MRLAIESAAMNIGSSVSTSARPNTTAKTLGVIGHFGANDTILTFPTRCAQTRYEKNTGVSVEQGYES